MSKLTTQTPGMRLGHFLQSGFIASELLEVLF
jgi:hypothetical protein